VCNHELKLAEHEARTVQELHRMQSARTQQLVVQCTVQKLLYKAAVRRASDPSSSLVESLRQHFRSLFPIDFIESCTVRSISISLRSVGGFDS